MPQTVSGEMYITGTSPFSPKWTKNDEENPLAVKTFSQGVTAVEISTPAEAGHGENPQLGFPDLKLKTNGASNGVVNDLQGLLRVQRFDFPLQVDGLMSEWNKSSGTLSLPSPGSRSSKTSTKQESKGTSKSEQLTHRVSFKHKNKILPLLPFSTVLKGERVKIPSFQSPKNSTKKEEKGTSEGKRWSNKDNVKNKNNNFLPPLSFSTSLKGQPVVTQGKDGSNKQRKQHGKTAKGNKFLQTDSKCQESCNEFEKIKTSKLKIKHQTRSNVASLKPDKHDIRSVFQLPKVDEYDITPDGKHTTRIKGCRVFKLNDLKTTLNYSGYKDSWVPPRDQYLMKCSVFKAIMQQPTVLLRQPSPVAGVKMTLQEEDSLAVAIQAVEKSNVPSPPIVAELTQQIKKFVIRLPPIC